jgi:nitric oxide dioxygenase
MSLSNYQIELVQSSFKQVAAMPETVAELFYGRLFEIAPAVRALFAHSDMKQQGRKLMQMISTAVNSLKNIGAIVPAVKQLGARHVMYGVTNEMYDVVGQALLWTLEQGLGNAFTEEVKDAWTAVYVLLAETAIAGANEVLVKPE